MSVSPAARRAAASRVRRTLITVGAASALTVALSGTGALARTSAAPPTGTPGVVTDYAFDAASYGSQTTGNPVVDSGPTALSYLPCTRLAPASDQNAVASVGDVEGVLLEGLTTANRTEQEAGTTAVVSRVHIASGSLAGGQVTFTDLTGVARSFADSAGFHVRTVSQIGSLTVGGVLVELPPEGEQAEIPVPGAGVLTLHRTVRQTSAVSATGAVNVLRFDSDEGTTEKVGRAYSRIDGGTEGGLFAGAAWGSDARADRVATLGRAALRPMPCAGTRGRVLRSSTAAVRTEFGFLGVRRSSVYGEQQADSASGWTRGRVASASFGDGRLRLRAITAVARVGRTADGDVVSSATGTGVGRVVVDGQPVQPSLDEPLRIPGLGSVSVRTVHRSPDGIDVTGVTVRLTNGTPRDRGDDTIVNLGRARLAIGAG